MADYAPSEGAVLRAAQAYTGTEHPTRIALGWMRAALIAAAGAPTETKEENA